MIRRDKNGGWILIKQNDHALLSGQVMTHWGNTSFARPDPYEEVLFAIKQHDSGWKYWDSEPKMNPENGYPANFTEMSPYDQSVIWSKCYRSHSAEHSYASALIALHFSKFNRSNLKKDPDNLQLKLLQFDMKDFISKELNFYISDAGSGEIPEQIRVNLKLLQIGDIISLTLCHGWRSIEITQAPVDYNGSETTLKMESDDGLNYIISPYPFNRELLEFHIVCRGLDKKTFPNDRDLRESIEHSQSLTLDFTLRKG
jgi:hypothetical protein